MWHLSALYEHSITTAARVGDNDMTTGFLGLHQKPKFKEKDSLLLILLFYMCLLRKLCLQTLAGKARGLKEQPFGSS